MSNSGVPTTPEDSNPTALTSVGEGIKNPKDSGDSKPDSLPISVKTSHNIAQKSENNQTKAKEGMEETAMGFLNNDQRGFSLSHVKTTKDLDQNSIRDMLRKHTGDDLLEIVSISQLEDMSGNNDAFNSSICSLSCVAKFKEKNTDEKICQSQDSNDIAIERMFDFVVKCPPTAKLIQFAHKFTKPFCNEVSWYLDLVQQLQLTQSPGSPPVLGDTLPVCYHAVSSYHTLEIEGDGDEGLSSCW